MTITREQAINLLSRIYIAAIGDEIRGVMIAQHNRFYILDMNHHKDADLRIIAKHGICPRDTLKALGITEEEIENALN